MFTTNKILLDSSIFIEVLKGRKTKLYSLLVSNALNEFFINEVILSEYLYYVVAVNGGASPKTIKEKGHISSTLEASFNELAILSDFTILPAHPDFSFVVPEFMKQYNLLPNDAIILATCKIHGITQLASHDADFIDPCKQEGIELLTE